MNTVQNVSKPKKWYTDAEKRYHVRITDNIMRLLFLSAIIGATTTQSFLNSKGIDIDLSTYLEATGSIAGIYLINYELMKRSHSIQRRINLIKASFPYFWLVLIVTISLPLDIFLYERFFDSIFHYGYNSLELYLIMLYGIVPLIVSLAIVHSLTSNAISNYKEGSIDKTNSDFDKENQPFFVQGELEKSGLFFPLTYWTYLWIVTNPFILDASSIDPSVEPMLKIMWRAMLIIWFVRFIVRQIFTRISRLREINYQSGLNFISLLILVIALLIVLYSI